MGCLCGQNRVASHLDAAVRAVLEAHRAGQTAGQLAVALAFRGASANRAPGDQIADVLGREQVQKFRAHGQAQPHHIQQQLARQLQPFVDGKAAVAARVVDIALPAHGGARLFEVHPHDDQQVLRQRIGLHFQLARVVHGLLVVVDGARANHHHQPVVLSMQHARYRIAAAFHQCMCLLGRWQPLLQDGGGNQGTHRLDAGVVNAGHVQRRKLRRFGVGRRNHGRYCPPSAAKSASAGHDSIFRSCQRLHHGRWQPVGLYTAAASSAVSSSKILPTVAP